MIVCVGEILADMIGEEKDGCMRYEQKAGGAPFNVACAAKKFGAQVAFVGSVGDDIIGDSLLSFAAERAFDGCYISKLPDKNTTLAFVSIDGSGERQFCFYRKNTADSYLEEVPDDLLKSADIVHIGSLMLSETHGVEFVKRLIAEAKKYSDTISFDVNFRSDIFKNEQEAVAVYKTILPLADIIKFSEDEIAVFGQDYVETALSDKLVFTTLGSKGSRWAYKGRSGFVPSLKVRCVDTTGAGDAFYAGVLTKLEKKAVSAVSDEEFAQILRLANVCGGLNTRGKGAIDNLPTPDEIQIKLKEYTA